MRKILIICLMIVSVFALNAQKFEQEMELAEAKMEQKMYKEAIKDYEAILDQDRSFIPAMSGKTAALYESGDLKAAFKYVEAAIQLYRDEPELFYNRGLLYLYDKQYQMAIQDFNKALDYEDSGIEDKIYLQRGIVYEAIFEYMNAIEDFDMAIDLKPNNIDAYYKRGVVNYRAQNYDVAIQDFNRVIEIEEENDVAFYNRGMSFYKMSKLQEACRDFHRACELGNKNACKMIVTDCTRQNR